MFGRQIQLFRLFGFSVGIDLSWLIIAVLITWSLAKGLFPQFLEGLPPTTYWAMGVVGALGLFASIVVHEFAHSLVARSYGLQIRGITLFIFGGVAQMADEPPDPVAEFMTAVAGPIASVLIAGFCLLLALAAWLARWPEPVIAVLVYLGVINGILVAFNLVPAFPLDGGRVLRSILWYLRGNLRWATRITTSFGSAFGFLLIFLGILSFIGGDALGGIWWFLMGLFLRNAAQSSYQQLLVRRALEGEPLARFVQPDVRTVPPSITLQELVHDYVYRYHFKMFPVVEQDRLLGCITTRAVKEVPQPLWAQRTVAEVAEPCSEENTIDLRADAIDALGKMHRSGVSRLMVIDEGRLRGVISLKDLLRLISLKLELEKD
jgi:Zn-dependent protease/CBS domain-containing protein